MRVILWGSFYGEGQFMGVSLRVSFLAAAGGHSRK